MGLEVKPAEVERRQGSLYSVAGDLTVTKLQDQVTPVCLSVCLSNVLSSFCPSPSSEGSVWLTSSLLTVSTLV